MRVIHLPFNTASQNSVTVRALRDIGVEANGLVIENSPIMSSDGIRCLPVVSSRKHPVRGILGTLLKWKVLLSSMRRADVIHWHFGRTALWKDIDLKYATFLDKARIVEFWGSDIRIPEIASADNPYCLNMYKQGEGYTSESLEHSIEVQLKFSQYGFECLVPGYELLSYVQEDLFPKPFMTKQRIMLSDYEPKYPDPKKRCPLIVHVPSHKGAKGTKFVLNAIDSLRSSYDFDFKLIHNVPRDEALTIMRKSDIILDQFITGDHGLTALESMALGKPTFCYVKATLISKYPSDIPLINANPDNLTQILKKLLENGQRRHEIGRKSRAYVEKYHDAHKLARQLVCIYEELLSKKRTYDVKKS